MQTQRTWTTGKSSLHLSPSIKAPFQQYGVERETELVSVPPLDKAAVEAVVSAAH